MYDEVVQRGWFRAAPERQRRAVAGLGTGLVVVGLASGWFFGLVRSVGTDQDGGFSLGIPSGIVLAAGLVVAGLLVRLLGKRMAATHRRGRRPSWPSRCGFKQYLATAEASQIRFEEAQDIFSRYLPYAIVFGVADRWARVFDEVAAAAAAAGHSLDVPTWYVFSGGGFGGFPGIASGMDCFSTTAAGTFTSTPARRLVRFSGSGFSAVAAALSGWLVAAGGRLQLLVDRGSRSTTDGARGSGDDEEQVAALDLLLAADGEPLHGAGRPAR